LHPHLEREQAFVDMFLDEARIAAQLHHPNVVSTLEIGTSERGYYLVMDYVEGDTLARLMVTSSSMGQKVPIPVLLRIIHDSLAGLHAAHELRTDDGADLCLVHRDVSPQNILVSTDGTARITDFGVARAATRLSVTREGQLKGKLGYMAPEQARGGDIDRRTDLFAVGVILWEALAGRRLFRGRNESDAETLHRILYEDIPRVSAFNSNVTPELDEVVAHALAKDPAERFQDGHSFAEALENATRAGSERIGTTREVARFVDEIVGKDIAARREAIKLMAPSEVSGISSITDMPHSRSNPDAVTATSVPKLLTSSMTPNSMSVGDLSNSMPMAPHSSSVTLNGLPTPPPPPAASGTSPLLVGILVGVSIAALAGATMLFVSAKNSNNMASGNPAPPASVMVISVPASVTPSATVAPVVSATATASASASAVATTKPTEHKPSSKPTPKGGDDLAPSPYH
jgi:serine/threonine-protein kinase